MEPGRLVQRLDRGHQRAADGAVGARPARNRQARIAPRLGRLSWARGTVPTPSGLIGVEATADSVTIDSPVPVVVDLDGRPPRTLPPGRHEMSVRREN